MMVNLRFEKWCQTVNTAWYISASCPVFWTWNPRFLEGCRLRLCIDWRVTEHWTRLLKSLRWTSGLLGIWKDQRYGLNTWRRFFLWRPIENALNFLPRNKIVQMHLDGLAAVLRMWTENNGSKKLTSAYWHSHLSPPRGTRGIRNWAQGNWLGHSFPPSATFSRTARSQVLISFTKVCAHLENQFLSARLAFFMNLATKNWRNSW